MERFNRHYDNHGEYIIMKEEKWYVGPPLNKEIDYYPDWLDKTLFGIMVLCVLAAFYWVSFS